MASLTDGTSTLASGNLTLGDGNWIGIGAALERILFDATGDDIELLGANVGIGGTAPTQLFSVGAASEMTVDTSGNIVTAGTLAVNGDSITSDGATLTINAGGAIDMQDDVTVDGLTVDTNALAVNSDSITSDGATLTINAGGAVDIQDNLTADQLTTDTGGVSIAAGQSYTGAGAVTLSSAATTALTINSGTTGNIDIGTDTSIEAINLGTGGTGAKTISIGTGNAGNTINIATDNTATDTLTIGSALDDIAITSDSWSVTNAGALTVAGVIAANGDSITADGATLTINAGGAVDIQDNLTEG